MAEQFDRGYALLIGVDGSVNAQLRLPAVAKDVGRLANVLANPELCGYRPENVKVLLGEDSTRKGILQGLTWLENCVLDDATDNATALVYYSGHGHLQDDRHYLLPYDTDIGNIPGTALPAERFAGRIAGLAPQRLLVVLDCCHAGSVGAKGGEGRGFKGSTAITPDAGSLAALASGTGRAVLSSSRGSEESWVRLDDSMSVFTYHFVEALTGRAGTSDAPSVLVTEVMDYIARQVPKTVRSERDESQVPVFEFSGESFPIALVLGGRGAAKGAQLPDPAQPLPDIVGVFKGDEVAGRAAGVIVRRDLGDKSVRGEAEVGKVKEGAEAAGVIYEDPLD
jgi:hypothetical protein